jgi:hypothetical protein
MNQNQSNNDTSLDFFLWVSHGLNISANYTTYPVETKFKAITFYSSPTFAIAAELLDKIGLKNLTKSRGTVYSGQTSRDFTGVLLGACPRVPVTDNRTKKDVIYLPSLVFAVTRNDNQNNTSSYMGLYHFVLQRADALNTRVSSGTKIYDYNDLVSRFGYYDDNKIITYSQIFTLIYQYCKQNNIDPNESMLGLYDCQDISEKYVNQYNTRDIKTLIPKNAETIEPGIILDYQDITNLPQNSVCSLSIISFQNTQLPQQWKPLANVKWQGCGLNVLSYYNLLSETEAREQTVCLDVRGTSIFRIIDYIHNSNIKDSGQDINKYFVMRLKMDNAIKILSHFIVNNIELGLNNYAIIFKMYKDQFIPGKETQKEYSEAGHTVSIAFKDLEVAFIDPQQEIYDVFWKANDQRIQELMNMTVNNNDDKVRKTNNFFDIFKVSIDKTLQKYAGTQFQFIDIIMSVREPPPENPFGPNRFSFPINDIGRVLNFYAADTDVNEVIRARPTITYGGKIKHKKIINKSRAKSNAKSNAKSRAKSKKQKVKKYRKTKKNIKTKNKK